MRWVLDDQTSARNHVLVWDDEDMRSDEGGYLAVITELSAGQDGYVFDTLEEAKEWLIAAGPYFKITGEIPPRDIHKREGV